MKKILLTGGAGFIGSHTAIALMEKGYDLLIADDLSNSDVIVIDRIEQICGKRPDFVEVDINQSEEVDALFAPGDIDGVIHFAGFKSVGESIEEPLDYYRNNIGSTLTLLGSMKRYGVHDLVFSSSATVYGDDNSSPLKEEMPRGKCTNPYGWTKSMIEQILEDAATADSDLSVVLLRYFNPIGAHETGLIGEDPRDIPNNLMPYITQVAVGQRPELTVFGDDYDTPDGTCRRDFIHVMDLAEGHVKAMEYALKNKGVEIFNLGTGTPHSVLEVVGTFEKASGKELSYRIGPRREGDLADVWADASKAARVLGWQAKRDLEDMCRDSWNWQSNNPDGYRGQEK